MTIIIIVLIVLLWLFWPIMVEIPHMLKRDKKKICSNKKCGAKIVDGANHCGRCGYNILHKL